MPFSSVSAELCLSLVNTSPALEIAVIFYGTGTGYARGLCAVYLYVLGVASIMTLCFTVLVRESVFDAYIGSFAIERWWEDMPLPSICRDRIAYIP